jgi:hypothetical protein
MEPGPKEKNTKEWCAWALREMYRYNPVFLAVAIRNGLSLNTLREYLSCLENCESGEKSSALLMELHHFNTISIWIAFKNGLNLETLRQYINCLEIESRP